MRRRFGEVKSPEALNVPRKGGSMSRLIALALLGVLSACQAPPAELTPQEEAAIVAEIDSLTGLWWEAWETFDVEEGLRFIHDEPETMWVGGFETLTSLAEMREIWPPMVEGLRGQELDLTNARTLVLARDLAWTLREFDYRVLDMEGTVVDEGQFLETALWALREGEWKILIGHDDSLTPVLVEGQ